MAEADDSQFLFECSRGHVASGKMSTHMMKPCPICAEIDKEYEKGDLVRFARDGRRYVVMARTPTGYILAKPKETKMAGVYRWIIGSEFFARKEAVREMQ